MERDPLPADFVGKTIQRIDTTACNVWRFYFTDGTAIAIEAEVEHDGIPVMQVCAECARETDASAKHCIGGWVLGELVSGS
jgi:hypothetical protein